MNECLVFLVTHKRILLATEGTNFFIYINVLDNHLPNDESTDPIARRKIKTMKTINPKARNENVMKS